MPEDLGPHLLEILPPGEKDEWGDTVPGSADPIPVRGCAFWPRGSTEEEGREVTVVTGMMALLPIADGVLTSKHQIRHVRSGLVYEVVGDPGAWYFDDDATTPAGVQVALKRATD